MSLDFSTPLPVRIAQAVAISSSFLLAGAGLGVSIFSIPRILESPTPLMLRQWKALYDSGAVKFPPLAAVAAGTWFWLAYNAYSSSFEKGFAAVVKTKVGSYIAAGAFVIGIVPYTFVFFIPTISKLMKKVDETKSLKATDEVVKAKGEDEARTLIKRWGILNLGRGSRLVIGSAIGLWTVFN